MLCISTGESVEHVYMFGIGICMSFRHGFYSFKWRSHTAVIRLHMTTFIK